MAQPFTPEQREDIRERLMCSARRRVLETGVKKTSLDLLTADAGISKSSFYKFFDSKEQLFLEIAGQWEAQILSAARRALEAAHDKDAKARAAVMVYTVFEAIHELGITHFLREDLPLLMAMFPEQMARRHYLTSARSIYDMLLLADIRFTAPDDVALSVIQLMYLSILNIGEIGETFFPALRLLVSSACERLVA